MQCNMQLQCFLLRRIPVYFTIIYFVEKPSFENSLIDTLHLVEILYGLYYFYIL